MFTIRKAILNFFEEEEESRIRDKRDEKGSFEGLHLLQIGTEVQHYD